MQAANARAGADEVVVPPGVYLLSRFGVEEANASGDLDVLDDLTIRGAGPVATVLQSVTIDRVLDARNAGTDLRVHDVTITGGQAVDPNVNGGGIRSNTTGELVVMRSVLRGNRAQGAASFGYGGAIHKAEGRLTVRDSAIVGNIGTATGYGGGVFLTMNGTSADFENVTITGNQASANGGGIFINNDIPVTLTHVTVTGNVAQQAGAIDGDIDKVVIRSSIVGGNQPDDCTAVSPATSAGGNVGPSPCGLTAVTDTAAAAQLGPLTPSDIPVLEPLAGSPARDRAVGVCPPADARGVARPQGAACDAGAAEAIVPAPPAPAPAVTGAAPVTLPAPAAKVTPRLLLPARITWKDSRVSVSVGCETQSRCRGTASIRTTGSAKNRTTLATGSFSIAAGRLATVRLKLTRKGRALLRRRSSMRVSLRIVFRGVAAPQTKTLTLQRRR